MTTRLWGVQQRVNVTTAGNQTQTSITTLNNGTFVVVWTDPTGSGDIYGRLYNAAGAPISGEIALASGAAAQIEPSVAALVNGGFQLVWTLGGTQIAYSAFGPTGIAGSTGVAVTATDASVTQYSIGAGWAAVYTLADTNLGVARYDSTGNPVGFTTVSTTNAGTQRNGDIARLSDDRYAIVWDNNGVDIRTRIMNSDGTFTTAGDIAVSTGTVGVTEPRVIGLQSGAFLVTWAQSGGPYPASSTDVYGRIILSSGVFTTAEFLINSFTGGQQFNPDVVALANGGFFVVWVDFNTPDTIQGQLFDAFGNRVGGQVLISSEGDVFVNDRTVSLSLLADGRIAVTWEASNVGGDTGTGIHLQIVDPRDGFITGTASSDLLYGGDFADQIVARDGADTIFAGFGDDVILAGAGADLASGDFGSDLLYGQDGNDTLNGADGDDGVFGGIGNDRLVGFTGADTLSGEDGNDTLFGEDGNDFGYGGAGDDTANGGNGDDYLTGFSGNDQLYGGPGNDQHYGEDGDDRMAGFTGDDYIDGGIGNDQLFGEDGNDGLYGGPGNDYHSGGNGDDRMAGFTGDDQLEGDAGNDELYGEDGNDGLYGGAGNDFHSGGEGNDRIAGSDGDDTIDGGGGNDEIYGELGADLITGGSGADRYIYFAVEQSRAFGADFIVDYSPGLGDTVELNLIDANVLVGGDQAFTVQSGYNGTAGQAVVYYIAASNITVFEADTNGDNISDFILQLAGNQTALTGFVL